MPYYEDRGIRFAYPADWQTEVAEDGPRTTITVQSPGGLAFALVTIDETGAEPEELIAEAMDALREEYPTLDESPAADTLAGHRAIGRDIEFISLDLTNACLIRGVRTPRRTLFLLGQWAEIDAEEDPEAIIDDLFRSIEETDDD
ncbi:hypothetical protein TA3x_002038 [Tundrisphaera sp. TA3]|uniref:hypothetical protein n=1 Tax=Tundrisphaera sp. TA3 TaxID=3435775 RepID=UPI003EC0BEA2